MDDIVHYDSGAEAPCQTGTYRHDRQARCCTKPLMTEREEEVLRAVGQGLTNQEIGNVLHVSLSTVETHLAPIQAKIHARNRVVMAAFAYRSGRMG